MGKTELYQLTPDERELQNCYVVKTANGKLVVIDGGIDGNGLEREPYLPSALRAILGIGQNDYFEVEAWFLSHQHRDHYYELAKMLRDYTKDSNYRINNFYFDFPEAYTEWATPNGGGDFQDEQLTVLKLGFENYFNTLGIKTPDDAPDKTCYHYDRINKSVANEAAIEKGLTISVDNVDFDILQTWYPGGLAVNSTSLIMRMRYKDHSVLFTQDAYIDASERLLAKYGAEALKSEYVQMGHHGQNGPSKLFYDAIDTKNSIRLWPTPIWVWEVPEGSGLKTYETRSWVGLPTDPSQFAEGTGRDIVHGLYKVKIEDPTKVNSWTKEVLNEQRVAVFD